jgi:TrmH family RNA methyltransferase
MTRRLAELRVVLVAPRNPLNIGAAARAMSNFGFSRLRLVNPYDEAFREARSAVNAAHVLETAEIYTSLAQAVADCAVVVGTTAAGPRALEAPLHRLEQAASLLRQDLARGRAALLFGSEKFGLSREDLSFCHRLLRIPTRGEHRAMNLGQAVALVLYELIRDPDAVQPGLRRARRADSEALERLAATLLECLETSGYLPPKARSSAVLKVRRLLRRLDPAATDADLLHGMLRQIAWKLRHPAD